MSVDLFLHGQKWLLVSLCVVCLTPVALVAKEQDSVTSPTTVQVALAGYTFAPHLTETGAPVLDEAGDPVILRVPLDESIVTPGDQVLYVVTLDNPTTEPAMNLQLGAQVAAELLLDPYSFIGPEGLVTEWADADAPDQFRPIFEEIDGEVVMTADLDALRTLRLTLPELPPSEEVSVEYTVTLR